MHPPETKNEFLNLRARGFSFAAISLRLKVSTPTLLAWNRQHLLQRSSPRALELKALEDTLPEQELLRCISNLRALEQELASRALRDVPTEQLQRFAAILQDRIQELYAVNERSTNGQIR